MVGDFEAVDSALIGRGNELTRAGINTIYPPLATTGAIVEEFYQPAEEVARFLAIEAQDNPLLQPGDFEIPISIRTKDFIEWLRANCHSFLETGNRTRTYKILRKLANKLKVYGPGLASVLNTNDESTWINALIEEMTEIFESNRLGDSDFQPYVRTTWPYQKKLVALAEKVGEHEHPSSPNIFFDKVLPVNRGRLDYIDWMQRVKGPVQEILNSNTALRLPYSPSSVLRMLAGDIVLLAPPNNCDLDLGSWSSCWDQLVKDMKMVDSLKTHPEIRFGGVYVLHSSPYTEFLRDLAARLSCRGM